MGFPGKRPQPLNETRPPDHDRFEDLVAAAYAAGGEWLPRNCTPTPFHRDAAAATGVKGAVERDFTCGCGEKRRLGLPYRAHNGVEMKAAVCVNCDAVGDWATFN